MKKTMKNKTMKRNLLKLYSVISRLLIGEMEKNLMDIHNNPGIFSSSAKRISEFKSHYTV